MNKNNKRNTNVKKDKKHDAICLYNWTVPIRLSDLLLSLDSDFT